MSVLDRILGKKPGTGAEASDASGENALMTAQLAAEVARMEASQEKTASELEQEKQKSANLQAKLDGAMTALRAGALRMAVRAHGAEGAQYEMAKATIEASDDPASIGKLMEACEKAVPATLASATGNSQTAGTETATDADKTAEADKWDAAAKSAKRPGSATATA